MGSQPTKTDPSYVEAFWDLITYDDYGCEVEMLNGAIGSVFDITDEDRRTWPELKTLQIHQVCLWQTDDGMRKYEVSAGKNGPCYYCGHAWVHHIPDNDKGILDCP